MLRLHAGRTQCEVAAALRQHGRGDRSATAARLDVWQLLLSANVVRGLFGQMVCVAPEPGTEGGVAAAEVLVSDVPDALLSERRLFR